MLVLLCAAALAACDDFEVGLPEVDGEWVYAARNLSGNGLTCQVTGLTLLLDEDDDSRFGGTASDGTLACTQDSVTVISELGLLPVISGRANGSRIQFDIGDVDWDNQGTYDGRSISGTTTLRLGAPFTAQQVTGTFGAARVGEIE